VMFRAFNTRNTLKDAATHPNTAMAHTVTGSHKSSGISTTSATYCNTLKHAATHCNTLQHTSMVLTVTGSHKSCG